MTSQILSYLLKKKNNALKLIIRHWFQKRRKYSISRIITRKKFFEFSKFEIQQNNKFSRKAKFYN